MADGANKKMSDPQLHQPLTHPVGVLYEIRWKEICPWLILVKALRVALLIRVLALALVGVMLTQWGSSTIDGFFSMETPSLTRITDSSTTDALPNLPLQADSPTTDLPTKGVLHLASTSPYLRGWHWVSQPFFRLADREISWQTSLILLVQGCWMMAVWAVFGGAIARIAAIYLTRGEFISPFVALRDAITVWPSTTGAALIALLGAMALAVPLVLLGFLLRMNFVAVVAGLLWCLVLAWGLMLAVVLLGLLLGWPLMWACLGVERSDAFDGVSRCYAYVYQKPLQLVFYVLIAALLAFLGEAVVNVFATASISITEWTLSWGAGSARASELFGTEVSSSAAPFATRAIHAWKWGVEAFIATFPLACLWPLSVGLYLLMRRQIDATEMEEITLSDDTTPSSLSNLNEKKSGVPTVEETSASVDTPKDE